MIGRVTQGAGPPRPDPDEAGGADGTGAVGAERAAVAQVAAALLAECPPGWRAAQVRHRRVGPFAEQDAAAEHPDGSVVPLPVPDAVREAFAALRTAQARAGSPRWYSARVRLTAPDGVTVETSVAEPDFAGAQPAPADYRADAAELPGEEPGWLAAVLEAEPVAAELGRTLAGLGLRPGAVRFGGTALGDGGVAGAATDGAAREVDGGDEGAGDGPEWRVLRRAGRWLAEAVVPAAGLARAAFDDPRDAAAFAVGRVVLTGPVSTPVHRGRGPFAPLAEDPPLSLFRDLRTLVLAAGTRLERHGGPGGTVGFLAGTPLPARSLPDALAGLPRRTLVVQRPVEVLAGTAVPWFGQPGGGPAVVLPEPVAELLRAGVLAVG